MIPTTDPVPHAVSPKRAGASRRTARRALARLLLLAAAALACAALATAAAAQTRPSATAAEAGSAGSAAPANLASVRSRIAAAETDKAIPDEVRPQVLQNYRDALLALESAAAHRQSAAEYRRASERAAAQSRVQARLAEAIAERGAGPASVEGITDSTSIEAIEQRQIKEQAALVALQKQLTEIERRIAAEGRRPQAARAELAQARAAASQIESEATAAAVPDEPRAIADSRRTLLAARHDEQIALIDRLEQEILSQAPRAQLLGAERDKTTAELDRQAAVVEAVDRVLYERRTAAAKEAQAEAQRVLEQAAQRYPALAPAAGRNVALGARLAQVVERTRAATQEREREDKVLASLEREFERLRPQLTGTSGPAAYGQTLFVYREQLRRMPSREGRRAAVLDELSRLGFELQQFEDERHALADLASASSALLTSSGLDKLPPNEREHAGETAEQLLREQRSLLDSLLVDLQSELRNLSELAATLGSIDARIDEFLTSIDSRLLWTRTVPPVGWETARQLPAAFARVLGFDAWATIGRSMSAASGAAWTIFALVVATAGLLQTVRRRLRRGIDAIATRVPATTAEGMRQTVEVMLATVLLAAPIPMGLLSVSWLALSTHPEPLGRGLASGIASAGAVLFWGELTRQVFRPRGLASVHFGWPGTTGERIWKEFRWSVPLTAVLLFVAIAASAGAVADRHSLGRIASALIGLVSTVAMHRVLYHAPASGAPPIHGQRVWYLIAVVVPALFALLPLAGYGFTALALGGRVLSSYWLVGAVVLLQGLASRLLSLRLAQERIAHGEAAAPASDDLESTERSARFLLRGAADFAFVIGLWWIWATLLPVLSNTTGAQLWGKPALIAGVHREVPVTLADLFLAVMVVVLTVVATRNIPGALRILMKSTVRTDASLRIAFSTVSQYLIVGVGAFSALTIIGADWSKLQWLVAALGVGLGFGLQEVVANFVCGLIILFERPIRVGDVVTVGDITGTVTKISVRATHITDFDRKSVLVPNKALITDRVTNWTLSDQLTRLVINVGVAYGSDPVRVQKLMLGVASGLPGVMSTPAPTVQLLRFGESSLDFEVRLFVSRLDERLTTTHDFHVAVERVLRENGIEIPFPQRDLHVRNWPAGAGPDGVK